MSKAAIAIVIGLAVAGAASRHRAHADKETGEPPVAERSADAAGHAIPIDTHVRRSPNGHFFVTALVNGQPVRFVVDTGATTVALTEEDALRAGVPFDRASFDVIGVGAAGPIRGQEMHLSSVELDGKERLHVQAVVLEGAEISLLGQSYLSRLNSVQMSGDQMTLR
jgi:aspartyl protease family protein